MTRIRFLLAVSLVAVFAHEASAQIFNLPVIFQPGVDIQYNSRRLKVNAFFPTGNPYTAFVPTTPTPLGFQQVGPAFVPYVITYPPIAPGFPYPGYGSIDQRITVQIINPPNTAGLGFRRIPDLSGIDLDIESPAKIWGDVAKKGPPKGDIAKAPPREDREVEVAKAEEAPKAAGAAREAKPAVRVPPTGKRLADDGIAAFRDGEYGLALVRFRQAADSDDAPDRTVFLRAQACIAVGKYHDAVELIQQGLATNPKWPTSGFNPRTELYAVADDWKDQRALLENAHARNPKDATPVFLLGYLAWFDGQREEAVGFFQKSRALATEPRWAEMFLKVKAS